LLVIKPVKSKKVRKKKSRHKKNKKIKNGVIEKKMEDTLIKQKTKQIQTNNEQ